MEKLYVVTSGLPGPGARTLIEALARSGPDAGPTRGGKYVAVDDVLDTLQGLCEFVELETADGRGVGPASGVDWEEHPNGGGMHRLGPFHALPTARDGEQLRRQVVEAAAEAFDAAMQGPARLGAEEVAVAHFRGRLLEEVDARMLSVAGLVAETPR